MQTTSNPSKQKTWAKAVTKPASEFPLTSLPVISGAIPESLHGTLYRNGPARLERGGIHMGHWFDGDGAILAIHFTPSGASAVYRYVQTDGYKEETAAGKLLYGNYGMTAPGPFWNRWLKPIKNAANTSVLALPDKLLALWEGGKPYALDLQTLATQGEDDLAGLSNGLSYSAHYKHEPLTGEIFNFGISPGRNAHLNLYKSDRTGKILQKGSVTLDGVPIVHDFVLAGQYLVFFIPPVRLNLLPALSMLSSFGDALEWQPSKGTQFIVVDRETLSVVSRGETEPWYQWHFANGYVDKSGSIIVEMVRYEDFSTNQRLKEVATGQTHTAARGILWQVQLNPQSGITSIQEVLDRDCEFPIVPQHQVGQPWRYTYLALQRAGIDTGQDLYGAIARFDSQTDTLTTFDFGDNRYPMEPIYAPKPEDPNLGWVITVVYDGNTDTSEVWIFDSDRIDESPVCRLGLPSVIPLGFHGTWKPA